MKTEWWRLSRLTALGRCVGYHTNALFHWSACLRGRPACFHDTARIADDVERRRRIVTVGRSLTLKLLDARWKFNITPTKFDICLDGKSKLTVNFRHVNRNCMSTLNGSFYD